VIAARFFLQRRAPSSCHHDTQTGDDTMTMRKIALTLAAALLAQNLFIGSAAADTCSADHRFGSLDWWNCKAADTGPSR